jgi:hypothetical protein
LPKVVTILQRLVLRQHEVDAVGQEARSYLHCNTNKKRQGDR